MLGDIALFLGAAVVFVPLFLKLRLGAVLGYLAAGMTIGPHGLGLIGDAEAVLHFAEFGVVLLLFIIGLELQPSRLWTLRRMVFGLGAAQVLVTAALLIGIATVALDLSWRSALIAGFALAMSSTAFVLQMLAERRELGTQHGRAAFATLLFQDLAVIPLLALVPLLAARGEVDAVPGWAETLKTLVAFALVMLAGRYAMRPLMRLVASPQVPELFTAAALLIVIGTALAMTAVGLTMSLGAFLAGMLLSDSEYRHQLQADIEPFKGMLLGLFFIAVGMSADLRLVFAQPAVLLGLVAGLLTVKFVVLYLLGRIWGLAPRTALPYASAMPQGGEFAFVLLTAAVAAGVMAPELSAQMVVVVTLSMIATPPLYQLQARLSARTRQKPYDDIDGTERSVIIAGFGPVGQIVARILRIKRIPFTVLDKDSEQVDFVRRYGNKIFYGDAGRIELLRAAHADKARLFVLTIPDVEASLHVATVVRRHFPKLRIFAIAVNRQHALLLMDMGIDHVVRRSFFSSLELSRDLLQALGVGADEARNIVDTFRRHDEQSLKRQQAVAHDEKLLIQSAQEAARELEQLFDQDPGQA